jgi:O-antigen ligase
LRAVGLALEAGVFLILAGSAAAFGAVHPESYRWMWLGGALLGALAGLRAAIAARLRRALGGRRIALDAQGRWHSFDDTPREPPRWSAALGPLASRAPLLLPGACFAAWALIQLVPLPPALLHAVSPGRAAITSASDAAWLPLTVSVADTRRGLAFLAVALLVHAAAAAALAASGARGRLLRGLSLLALALSLLGLVQRSLGVQKIYGVFAPLEGGGSIFGPFVNRNHFAGYLLMLIPAALAVVADVFRRLAAEAGRGRGWRQRALALATPPGTAVIYWMVPVLAATAALLATQSRGGMLALLLGLGVLVLKQGRAVALWLVGALLAVALGGPVVEGIQERFARTPRERLLRTLVWQDALERSREFRWLGTGFNTYATALNRVDAWTLPEGATAWPSGASPADLLGPRGGFRVHTGSTGDFWYSELHNDYLQVLIETGVPGLLLALWAAAAALLRARADPWVLAALTGVLFHELVDFDLQIPALALLFVTLAAAPGRHRRHANRPGSVQAAGSV